MNRKYNWVQLCFEYKFSTKEEQQKNWEVLILDYVAPFIEKIESRCELYHFLMHRGLDLRMFGEKSFILKTRDEFFADVDENHPLLRNKPYESLDNAFKNVEKEPLSPYVEARERYLHRISQTIIEMLKLKREGKIKPEILTDTTRSDRFIVDITHYLLNQLGFFDLFEQSNIFMSLSNVWLYSGIYRQFERKDNVLKEIILFLTNKYPEDIEKIEKRFGIKIAKNR